MKVTARVLSAAVLAAALGIAAPADAAAPRFVCNYVILGASPGWFWADLYITNRGPAMNGWNAHWTMRHFTTNLVGWSAIMTMPTPFEMTAVNAPWNGRVPPGGTVAFGWTAQAFATEVPTDITVNGVPC